MNEIDQALDLAIELLDKEKSNLHRHHEASIDDINARTYRKNIRDRIDECSRAIRILTDLQGRTDTLPLFGSHENSEAPGTTESDL